MHLTKRTIEPERMDDPDVDRTALDRALVHLAKSNRRLGGTRGVLRQFERWSADWNTGERISIIDVGTGSADIPIALADWAAGAGYDMHITAIDLHEKTLDAARANTSDRDNISIVQADARELMDHFKPDSFDYAHAGLFLHHLQDLDVMTVLRIMQRLSRRGILWNDLIRSSFTKLVIRPFSWTGPAVFRHDAIASMNAGFTKREAIDLATRTGIENIRYRSHLFHRFFLTGE